MREGFAGGRRRREQGERERLKRWQAERAREREREVLKLQESERERQREVWKLQAESDDNLFDMISIIVQDECLDGPCLS